MTDFRKVTEVDENAICPICNHLKSFHDGTRDALNMFCEECKSHCPWVGALVKTR